MTQKSTISIKDVEYVATLAKIAVSEAEAVRLRDELDTILGYVRQLDELDTSNIEPTYQVTGLSNMMRDDQLDDEKQDGRVLVTPDELLRLAPQTENRQLKVPKVL